MIQCDDTIASTFELLRDVQIFSNPYRQDIDGLKTLAMGKLFDVDQLLLTLTPVHPDYAKKGLLEDFKARLVDMVGGMPGEDLLYRQSAVGQYSIYTDFMSGQGNLFPINDLTCLSSVPNIALLGGMTFFSLMSLSRNLKGMRSELCTPDPEDPCGDRNSLFGIILGSLHDGLLQMMGVLQGISDLLSITQSLVDSVAAFVQNIVDTIATEVTRIIQAVIDSIKLGLAKMLKALTHDPCLVELLQRVGTPMLRDHLATVLNVG